MENLLEVKNLQFSFRTYGGVVKAVRDVSFEVRPGEILGIVGESGCGKSVLCKSIMKLLPPSAKIKEDSICVNGQDITCYREREMQKLRGRVFAMIFQDPMTSLNPVATVGDQIAEAIIYHSNGQKVSQEQIDQRVGEVLEMVGIPAARKNEYPHQFSGGMKQRVVIAMALSCQPDLLIADEPTTALDVTVQAQIMTLLNELKREFNTAIIMITHDLGVVAGICDKVLVMYAGRTMEYGNARDVFYQPVHPYSIGLLNAVPRLDAEGETMLTIPGNPPNLLRLPKGCPFQPRCPHAMDICSSAPPLEEFTPGRLRACFKPVEELL